MAMNTAVNQETPETPDGPRPLDQYQGELAKDGILALTTFSADVSMPYAADKEGADEDPLDTDPSLPGTYIVVQPSKIPERRYPQLRGKLELEHVSGGLLNLALGN